MLDPGSLPGKTASLDFGEQTELERERKAVESSGSPGAPQPGTMPGGPPPGGVEPGAPVGGPPVQPAPRQPLSAQDLVPGGPVFSEPKLRPTYPWRQELRMWAQHPNAGPFLAAARQRADANLQQQPPPEQKQ